jgi:predicted nucleotide-binding protein
MRCNICTKTPSNIAQTVQMAKKAAAVFVISGFNAKAQTILHGFDVDLLAMQQIISSAECL